MKHGRTTAKERTVLNSTKILGVPDGVALSSDDVRSAGAPTTRNLYLKGLVELFVCRFDHRIVREDCETGAKKSMCESAPMRTERT